VTPTILNKNRLGTRFLRRQGEEGRQDQPLKQTRSGKYDGNYTSFNRSRTEFKVAGRRWTWGRMEGYNS